MVIASHVAVDDVNEVTPWYKQLHTTHTGTHNQSLMLSYTFSPLPSSTSYHTHKHHTLFTQSPTTRCMIHYYPAYAWEATQLASSLQLGHIYYMYLIPGSLLITCASLLISRAQSYSYPCKYTSRNSRANFCFPNTNSNLSRNCYFVAKFATSPSWRLKTMFLSLYTRLVLGIELPRWTRTITDWEQRLGLRVRWAQAVYGRHSTNEQCNNCYWKLTLQKP